MENSLDNTDLLKIAELDRQYLVDALATMEYPAEMVSPTPTVCYEQTPFTSNIAAASPEPIYEDISYRRSNDQQLFHKELHGRQKGFGSVDSFSQYGFQYYQEPTTGPLGQRYSDDSVPSFEAINEQSSNDKSPCPVNVEERQSPAGRQSLQQNFSGFSGIIEEESKQIEHEPSKATRIPTVIEDIAAETSQSSTDGPIISYVEDAELGRVLVIENRKPKSKRGRKPVAKIVVQVTDHKCGECGRMFVRTYGLKQHINQVHGAQRNFRCPICGKWYATEKQLKVHQRRHDKGKNFPCTVCNSEFNFHSDLVRHINHRHRAARYRCKHCDKPFERKDHLKKHEIGHVNNTVK
ncbi:zinc finger and BTB domain-containing protein 14-like [Uranotaenia lowii]|uniref:zinc finger and BTB domain-containing protein 14-like n=1 Tax=Uranotaenia lowii TaxID=190385 RepID=UPI00247A0F7D|nr:zinc finger and BTB domain-containing protein 14-like [Uranotaenia lowii]